ncbi:ABC transporter ATP-binding protein [Azospirillum sp.]|uniref:ABC transporter ATP-binding protein n=1 Tax=Azospirillum sp. TaxID=34012 RepID=UPI002D42223C|nr:ABC transporter ATP-binding protein [Azospirillum sp.]HYD69795.1 ABC transporter ATP-binding protein [Azospirillum sp.]
MSQPILAATGLHTFYGPSQVLHGVDFRVHAGETVALMGRNGMGKTTTLRSILGLVRPKRGRVEVFGADVTSAATPAIVRRGIGYVPEGRGIFANLSVREHLVMAARKGPNGRADWDFERVLHCFPRLAERIDSTATHLSGGEQQMLSIGRALMTNPDLLVLDEATEGLAPLIRRSIWQVIREIKATGIATVIVDKNVDVLLDLTDRAAIMVKGRVVYDGPSVGLKADPGILRTHIGL